MELCNLIGEYGGFGQDILLLSFDDLLRNVHNHAAHYTMSNARPQHESSPL